MASSRPKQLNVNAPTFVPGSYSSTVSFGDMSSEDHITAEELEELEMVEEWVEACAALEELEEDHLVAVALRDAPPSKVAEIQRRFGVKVGKMRGHRGIRSRAHPVKAV